LKRRDRIIAAINNRYRKRDHKFGIEVPKTVEEALALDKKNGNDLWEKAIQKEAKTMGVALKPLNADENLPPGYSEIGLHWVFDVKMEDFRRKARLVANPHTSKDFKVPSPSETYASVIGRETVRIALTMAALNDLEVKTADIEGAYLTTPAVEKLYCKLGREFGEHAGKRAIITRAIYGTFTAASAFRNHFADCLRNMGYTPCKADPDLWMKPSVREDDGYQYFAYILVYVDDAAVVHHNAMAELRRIDKFFKFKDGSMGDPDYYLGAKLKPVQLQPSGVWAWGMSASKYIQAAVKNVEEHCREKGISLPKTAKTPFPNGYRPDEDVSDELKADDANFFQSQIGVLRWMVELGRVDMITEISMLSTHLALPREGHLEAVYHVYRYLKARHNSRIVFDPSYPEIDLSNFQEHDWTKIYGDVKEAIPPDAPSPRGKGVDIRAYVDSDHANDKSTRRSRTGFFIFINNAPIIWFSKKQSTIETSVFGAEFVALKTVMETLRGLRYKLRMMGIPVDGPSYIFGDNMSVIHNTQRPESTLKKKSNSICYHAVRESVAMNESRTGHIASEHNLGDLATKIIPGGAKRNGLIGLVMHDIVEGDHDFEP
jgi:hypothetical protein